MKQFLEFDHPIPSCEVYGMSWRDDHWVYTYALSTPFELTDGNNQDMIVYQFISDLVVRLAAPMHHDSVNLHFRTLSDFLSLLDRQVQEDKAYREGWLAAHPEVNVSRRSTFILPHGEWLGDALLEHGVHYVADYLGETEGGSIFAGV